MRFCGRLIPNYPQRTGDVNINGKLRPQTSDRPHLCSSCCYCCPTVLLLLPYCPATAALLSCYCCPTVLLLLPYCPATAVGQLWSARSAEGGDVASGHWTPTEPSDYCTPHRIGGCRPCKRIIPFLSFAEAVSLLP